MFLSWAMSYGSIVLTLGEVLQARGVRNPKEEARLMLKDQMLQRSFLLLLTASEAPYPDPSFLTFCAQRVL